MASPPAAAFTRESSLVGIQVLSNSSNRLISFRLLLAASLAVSSSFATAVTKTTVPIKNWLRLTTWGKPFPAGGLVWQPVPTNKNQSMTRNRNH